MDWACEVLVEVLRRSPRMGLKGLVEATGLARQTVHSHLKHLAEGASYLRRQ